MSAFGGKADIASTDLNVRFLTHSGHERLKIAALQTDLGTPFRRSQIPAVITDAVGVVLSLGAGNATARFHQSDCWISRRVAARRAGAAAEGLARRGSRTRASDACHVERVP